jgi:hypothetical protein
MRPKRPISGVNGGTAPAMSLVHWLLAILLSVSAVGCSERTYDEIIPQSPGSITAIAQHVGGHEGDFISVGVWGPGIDWTPATGAEMASAYAQEAIDSADFSMTHTMTEMGRDGSELDVEKMFEPGDYSVVFFIGGAASSYDRFAEIRIHVNGNMFAEAPDSSAWTAPSPH